MRIHLATSNCLRHLKVETYIIIVALFVLLNSPATALTWLQAYQAPVCYCGVDVSF